MAISLSHRDVTKEITSVKSNPLLFLSLRELSQLLGAKKSSPDILRYWESETETEAIEEREALQVIYSWLFHEILRYPEEEKETYTSEIPIESYPSSSIILGTEQAKSPQELEQIALSTIYAKFSKIEKVKSIYVQRYREELQVQVLLSINQYDDDLMDTLLDIEYDIRKMFPEIVFEFFYPPAGISEKKDFIHPQAECIYMR